MIDTGNDQIPQSHCKQRIKIDQWPTTETTSEKPGVPGGEYIRVNQEKGSDQDSILIAFENHNSESNDEKDCKRGIWNPSVQW